MSGCAIERSFPIDQFHCVPLRRSKRTFSSFSSDEDESESLTLTHSLPLSESFGRSDCISMNNSMMSSGSLSCSDSSGSLSLSDSLISSDCLSFSDSLTSSSTNDALMDDDTPSEQSTSPSPSKVSFSETVKVREIFQDEDSDKEEQVDSITDLKEGDFTSPTIIPIKYSPEEEAMRSKLTGCLPAEVRVCHDFAKMYGCGKTIRSMDIDMIDDDDDDDDFLNSEPVRVIEAHAPSSFWFTPM